MGRHRLPVRRRRAPAVKAAILAPLAVAVITGGSAYPRATSGVLEPIADATPCCAQIVAAPAALLSDPVAVVSETPAAPMPASRLRVVSRFLSAGVAPERGLQVRTILAARSISDTFPEIHQIGGVRPDGLRWHPNGLALDVMIPNPGSAEGIALGDAIVTFALENAARFGLQDVIWRGGYYTPDGVRGNSYGHYDHVHITTTGGGYPTGAEIYFR